MKEKFNIYLWVSSHGLETILISEVKAQVDPQSIHRSNCNSESPEVNLGHRIQLRPYYSLLLLNCNKLYWTQSLLGQKIDNFSENCQALKRNILSILWGILNKVLSIYIYLYLLFIYIIFCRNDTGLV